MKSNDIKALPNKTVVELETQLQNLSESLTNAYLEKAARRLKNPASIKNIRADIARVKTVLRQKELSATDESQTETK